MAAPRKAAVNIKYTRANKNGSRNHSVSEMATYTGGFSFTEAATDEIDSISVSLTDKDFRWINSWMPKKGDKLEATIIMQNAGKQSKLYCGRFCLDDISASGPDFSCEIMGTSVPELGAIRCVKRTKKWKNANFEGIARKIAKRYHLKLKKKSKVKIGNTWTTRAGRPGLQYKSTVKQNNEEDLNFFMGLCQKHGMGMKITSGSIVLYNKAAHELKNHSAKIDRKDMLDWTYNNTLIGTYTGARFKYKAGKNKKTGVIGKGGRMLVIKECFGFSEAKLNACAKTAEENEKNITMSATVPGSTKLRAGDVVRVTGLHQLNGKYFIDKAVHTIDADSGYTVSLEMHKCFKRLTPDLFKDPTIKKEGNSEAEAGAVNDGAIFI